MDEQGEVVSYTPGGAVDERVKTMILAGGENGVKEGEDVNMEAKGEKIES